MNRAMGGSFISNLMLKASFMGHISIICDFLSSAMLVMLLKSILVAKFGDLIVEMESPESLWTPLLIVRVKLRFTRLTIGDVAVAAEIIFRCPKYLIWLQRWIDCKSPYLHDWIHGDAAEIELRWTDPRSKRFHLEWISDVTSNSWHIENAVSVSYSAGYVVEAVDRFQKKLFENIIGYRLIILP